MDWVLTVFKGDGRDFDMGVDYTECGFVKYFAALGMPELAPYPCQIDFPTLGQRARALSAPQHWPAVARCAIFVTSRAEK